MSKSHKRTRQKPKFSPKEFKRKIRSERQNTKVDLQQYTKESYHES